MAVALLGAISAFAVNGGGVDQNTVDNECPKPGPTLCGIADDPSGSVIQDGEEIPNGDPVFYTP